MCLNNIRTICRYNQVIDKDVLKGIIINDCNLLVFSSDKGTFRENVRYNWIEALRDSPQEVILMDSDVVLCRGVIEVLKKEKSLIVTLPTKHSHLNSPTPPHSLMLLRDKGLLLNFLKQYSGLECPICAFLKGKTVKVLWDYMLNEKPRTY